MIETTKKRISRKYQPSQNQLYNPLVNGLQGTWHDVNKLQAHSYNM